MAGRRAYRRTILWLACCCLAGACGGEATTIPQARLWPRPEYQQPAGPLLAEIPALADVSSWVAEGCGRGQPSDPSHLGDFGIGNGRVFALAGYACPLNTLHTMAGPDYQQESDFYQDTWFELEAGGQVLEVSRALAFRPRRSATLLVVEQAGDLEWYSLSFAPLTGAAGAVVERALVRIIEVHNRAATSSPELAVVTREAESSRQGRRRTLVCLQPESAGDPARVELGALAGGEWRRLVLAYVTGRDDSEIAQTTAALQGSDVPALLGTTLEQWRDFHDQAASLESPDVRVDDLLEGVLTTVHAQTTYLGGVSPMSRYSLMWIRDTAGTVRFLVRLGLYEQARRLLAYYHRAASARGDIANAVDLDVSGPVEEPDWDNLGPFSGRQAAEGPSYIPLMTHWYTRASGDTSLLEETYPMLRRCLLRQQLDENDLLTFSGDETYRAALSLSLGLDIEHDYPACCRSANSSFLFVAAARALAGRAEELGQQADADTLRALAGRVRQAAETTYLRPDGSYAPFIDLARPGYLPPPFEDVVTKPLWTGYLDAGEQRARDNLQSAVEQLGRSDGFLQSDLDARYHGYMGLDIERGVHTGMAPGYYLFNLASCDHPQLERAFDALGLAASPAGNFSEYHVYDDHSILQPLYDSSGYLGDITARYRHWEGAVSLDALVYALTGLECDAAAGSVRLAPRLVDDWPRMQWRKLRCGDVRLELLVEELGGRRRVTVTASGDIVVHLELPLGGHAAGRVEVDGQRLDEEQFTRTSWFGRERLRLEPFTAGSGREWVVEVRYR